MVFNTTERKRFDMKELSRILDSEIYGKPNLFLPWANITNRLVKKLSSFEHFIIEAYFGRF